MKKTLKKVLIIFLIILILNNFFISSVNCAEPPEMPPQEESFLLSMASSVIGLLTLPIRLVAIAAAWALNTLTAGIAYIEGTTDTAGETNTWVITPFDIFFNKVRILDVNFFDIGTEKNVTNTIRTGIASWYYVMRIIAASILLVILIYVGIRMAISTVASDKAMYKKMLVDWIVSLALIFIMQYIIIFAVTVNSAIINSISLGVNSELISDTYNVIMGAALEVSDLDSVAATAIYCILIWQTFGLVVSYFNRMLKLAFLVIISPLITLTYSIDKMGDGKAQALGNWLKEFVYTILIQPFHCIIYMCFVDVGFKLLTDNSAAFTRNTLATAVVAILCVRFVKDGENIVRRIFQFKDENSGTSLGAGLAIAAAAMNNAKSIGATARSALNGTKNMASMAKSTVRGAKDLAGRAASGITTNAAAAVATLTNKGGEDKSFSERKEDIRAEKDEKAAEKIENKYDVQSTPDEIKKLSDQIMQANKGISRNRANAMARLNLAQQKRAKSKGSVKLLGGKGKLSNAINKTVGRPIVATIKGAKTVKRAAGKPIKAARGAVRKVKRGLAQSDTLKSLGSLTAGTISMGLGTMVGTGLYGTGSNMATALMSGIAMNKGVQSFFQNSTKTLSNNATDNYAALNVKSKYGVHNMTKKIMGLFSDDDAAKRELTRIVDEIEQALKEAGVEGIRKTQIKNTVERGITADGSRTQEVVKFALESIKDKDGNIIKGADGKSLYETNDGQLREKVEELADYVNKNQIYKTIKAAGDLNVDNDTFVEEIMKNFDDEYDPITEEVIEQPKSQSEQQIDQEGEIQANDTSIETSEDEKVLENIIDELLDLDLETYRGIDKVKMRAMLKRSLNNIEGKVTEEERKMEKEYEKQLDNKIKELEIQKSKIQNSTKQAEAEAKLIKMKQVKEQLEKRQNDMSNMPN